MVLKRIRGAIDPAIKNIEGDIYKVNRDRVIIGLANWMASKKLNKFKLSYLQGNSVPQKYR